MALGRKLAKQDKRVFSLNRKDGSAKLVQLAARTSGKNVFWSLLEVQERPDSKSLKIGSGEAAQKSPESPESPGEPYGKGILSPGLYFESPADPPKSPAGSSEVRGPNFQSPAVLGQSPAKVPPVFSHEIEVGGTSGTFGTFSGRSDGAENQLFDAASDPDEQIRVSL